MPASPNSPGLSGANPARRATHVLMLTTVCMLMGCAPVAIETPNSALNTASPVASPSASAIPVTVPGPSATSIPAPPAVVDASTLHGKLLMGYQGWFSCPTDGTNTRWYHWFKDGPADAAHFRVDMYPDASELTPEERCATLMKFPDGRPAPVYSAVNLLTVKRHFKWMQEYGIDGVFLQRFVRDIEDPAFFHQREHVTDNVVTGAETYGRVFAVEYDISEDAADPTLVAEVERDWKYLVDVKHITESPSYLRHNGKPVVGVYGFGLYLYTMFTPAQGMELLEFFENNPDPKYQATLMGGVPDSWRTLTGDALSDPAWAEYFCSLDVISPWTVGRYSNLPEADAWRTRISTDMEAAQKCGAEYMPVVWPGTAFHNDSGTAFNQIPRLGGRLYWRQVYNAISLGAPMIFNAMFDEVDEDTAMFKIAATSADQPVGVELAAMDVDGEKLPNDWYLRLAGAATQMLRGDIPLTDVIPLNPDGSLVQVFPSPVPTPMQYQVRVVLSTSSDWTTLKLVSGGQWAGPVNVLSASPEATTAVADGKQFALNQASERARAGESVSMSVDLLLVGIKPGQTLTFEIQRGSLGETTVAFMNMYGAKPTVAVSESWSKTVGTAGLNPHQFSFKADLLLPAGE